jgi:threonyl-tRNA synthetase
VKGSAEDVAKDTEGRALDLRTPEGREIYRHSTSHIMATALQALYPETKFTIGPPTKEGEKYGGVGFYYDIDLDQKITPEDFPRIEKKMRGVIAADFPFLREEISRDAALERFRANGQSYKVEIIESIPAGETLSLYRDGDFVDLCRGPHVERTGVIKAFKLMMIAGAYWRGDVKNKMLQRLYGVAFPTQEELDDYLHKLEEAEKRDHRKIGQELDLFSTSDDYGPGLIFWHPKGARLRNTIERFWFDAHFAGGYEVVYTPHIAKEKLWDTSGHLGFYADRMYAPMEIDEINYRLKPMNCPFHIRIYKNRMRSYRELPLRWAELGTVYRYEQSGELHGLKRVRGFTQDDAHLFCTPEQLEPEIRRVLDFVLYILRTFGFTEYEIFLSTRPEHSVGSDEGWEHATAALRGALDASGLAYSIDPGEGVFYGPKIDIKIKDNLDRAWQCSTIQVDFNLPERFDMTFKGSDGKEHRPIMIHRALMGSMERFFGCLIEHYAGAFPTWLAPVQAAVLPVTDRDSEIGARLVEKLNAAGIRAEIDAADEKLGFRIRRAQTQKIPYMLVLGSREAESGTVSVRSRELGDLGSRAIDDVIALLSREIDERALRSLFEKEVVGHQH